MIAPLANLDLTSLPVSLRAVTLTLPSATLLKVSAGVQITLVQRFPELGQEMAFQIAGIMDVWTSRETIIVRTTPGTVINAPHASASKAYWSAGVPGVGALPGDVMCLKKGRTVNVHGSSALVVSMIQTFPNLIQTHS
nr:uncharacterized protein LOC129281962 [Lytechinus pictus]